MVSIERNNDNKIIDYMARDYDSLLKTMEGIVEQKLPEWKDYKSETDFGRVLMECFAHAADIISYYQDRVANESYLGTARTRRSLIHHLRLIGYKLATAAPAAARVTLNFPPDCNDTVTIQRGYGFATKSSKDKPSVRFEYTGENPLTIQCSQLQINYNKKSFSGIPVEEGRCMDNEVIGISDGSPNQRFGLGHKQLILRPVGAGEGPNPDIRVQLRLGDTREEWTWKESLVFSYASGKHFTVDIDEDDYASILFGDNVLGAIPPAGSQLIAYYRVGGGTAGNVPRESILTLVDAPALSIAGAKVHNPLAATGGADRETIEHAVQHAPYVFRAQQRAVTAEDYRSLALNFKGVGKVRVAMSNWNSVILFVAPEGGGRKASDVLKANLLSYFEEKRPISTLIEIEDVVYVEIFVTVKIKTQKYYLFEEVAEKVKKKASEILAFEKVDFKEVIYLSKLYEAIESIEGVDHAVISEFRRLNNGGINEDDGSDLFLKEGKIALKEDELPCAPDSITYQNYAGGIQVVEEKA